MGLRQRRAVAIDVGGSGVGPHHSKSGEREEHPLADDDLDSDDGGEEPADCATMDAAAAQEALFERRRQAALIYPEHLTFRHYFYSSFAIALVAFVLYDLMVLAFTSRHCWLLSKSGHWLWAQYVHLKTAPPRHEAPGFLDWLQWWMPSDDYA